MAHKGLSPDAVVKAAVELIEQQGREHFPCGFWQISWG